MTYAQLKAIQARGQFAQMDPKAFAALMGQMTGNPEALQSLANPSTLSLIEDQLQQGIQSTGLPKFFGGTGELLFGSTGREVFEQVPRSAANLLPLAASGPVGWAGAGLMGLSQGWGATEQVVPSLVSGALSAATPGIAGAGARAGVNAVRAARGTGLEALEQGFASGVASRGVNEVAEQLAQSALPRNMAEMAGRVAGEQVALLGADVAGEAVSIAADPNRTMDELASPEYWAAQAISNLPFLGFDVAQGRRDLAAGRQEFQNAPMAFQRAEDAEVRKLPLTAFERYAQFAERAQGQPKEGPALPPFQPWMQGLSTPLPPELTVGQQVFRSQQTGPGLAGPRAVPGLPNVPPMDAFGNTGFPGDSTPWTPTENRLGFEQENVPLPNDPLGQETSVNFMPVTQQYRAPRFEADMSREPVVNSRFNMPGDVFQQYLLEQAAQVTPPTSMQQKADAVESGVPVPDLTDFNDVEPPEKARKRATLHRAIQDENPVVAIAAVQEALPQKERTWLNKVWEAKMKAGMSREQALIETITLAKDWALTKTQKYVRKQEKLGGDVPLDESLSLTGGQAWNQRELSDWIEQRQVEAEGNDAIKAELALVDKKQKRFGRQSTDATRSDRPQNEVWGWYKKWVDSEKEESLEKYLEKNAKLSAIDDKLPGPNRPSPTKSVTTSRDAMAEAEREARDYQRAAEAVGDNPDVARQHAEKMVRNKAQKFRDMIWPEEVLQNPAAKKAVDIVMDGLSKGQNASQLSAALLKGMQFREMKGLLKDEAFQAGMRRLMAASETDRGTLFRGLDGAVDMETRQNVETVLQLKDILDAEQKKTGVVDTLRRMLEASGADATTIARDLPTLVRLWNFSQAFKGVDLMSLGDKPGRVMQGLYASDATGRRLVAAKADSATRLQWVLAHELTGHGLWDAAAKGLLPELDAVKLGRFREYVKQMSPAERRKMLQDAASALPRSLREDPEVQALLDTELGHADAEEVLANLNAIAALNLVSGKRGELRDQVKYLPKFFGDLYDVAARYMEKIINVLRGFVSGPDARMYKEHVENLRAIMRAARESEKDAAIVQRMDKLTAPGGWRSFMENPDEAARHWQELLGDPENARVAGALVQYLGGDDLKKAGHLGAAGMVRTGRWLAHTFQPIIQFGSRIKKARFFTQQQQAANERVQGDITRLMELVGANYDGTKTVVGAKGPEHRVSLDPAVGIALDKAISSIQKPRKVKDGDKEKEVRYSVEEALQANDPEVVDIVKGLSMEQKNLLLEAAANRRLFHRQTMEVQRKYNHEFAAAQAATTSLKLPTGDTLPLSYEPIFQALESMVPRWGKLGLTGDKNVDEPLMQAFQDEVAQAMQAVGHDPVQAKQTAIHFVAMLDAADKAYKRQISFDSYVNESRQGEFKVSFTVDGASEYAKLHGYKNADHGYASANTREDAEFLAQIYKDKGLKDVRVIDPTEWRAKHHQKVSVDLEDIIEEETKQLEESLIARGLDPDKVKDAIKNYDLLWKINRDKVAHDMGTLTITRRYAPGRESLNMGEQQTHHLQAMLRGAQRRINEAIFMGMKRDVDFANSPEAAAVLTSWRNNMEPDSQLTRALGKTGYMYALGLNMPNYAQEWVQGITGFPTKLIDEGAGFAEAYKLVVKAQKDTAKMQGSKQFLSGGILDTSGLPRDEAQFIKEAMEEGLMGNGMLSEITEDTIDQQYRKQKVAAGWAPDTATSRIGEVADKTFNAVTRLHSKFTAGSTSTALLAGYRFLRSKGLDEAAAKKQAKVLFREGMMIGGRYNRPAGLWDSGAWTPASAMVSSLQSFTLNTVFNTINLFRRAVDGKLPRGERIASTKALANAVIVQTLLAGVMGLPFVGAATAIAEKATGFDLQAAMAKLSGDLDDPLIGGTANQIALRGLFRAFNGPDVGSRYGMGNIMGLNENDGFSFENLFGPVGSLVGRSVLGLGMLAKGEPLEAAAEVAPVALRKTLKLWSDDWQFRAKKGNLLIEDPTVGERLQYMLGLTPTRLNAARETYNMTERARAREHKEEVEFSSSIADQIKDGDVMQARRMLAEKAQEDDIAYEDLVERVVAALENRTFQARPTREGTRQTAEVDAAIARGYDQVAPVDEMERATFKDQMAELLGGTSNEKRLREAAAIDAMRKNNPLLTVRQAKILLEKQTRRQMASTAGLRMLGVQ